MDGADESGWSAVATGWAELWGPSTHPVHLALIEAAGIRAGTRVLDVGCGSGELLATLGQHGADAWGLDPAPGMVALAGGRARLGGWEGIPWPDGSFDVVTAVNALQFADDPEDALAEAARVLAPGGFVAIANWAEGALSELTVLEEAVAVATETELLPDDGLRSPDGLSSLLVASGFSVVAAGLVPVPWVVPDADALVRGVLLGEDEETVRELAPAVLAAAELFRAGEGYRLENAFRYAVGRASAS